MTKTNKNKKRTIVREICGFTILCSIIAIIVGFFMVIGCEDPITNTVNYVTMFVGLALIVSGGLCGYEANRIGNGV